MDLSDPLPNELAQLTSELALLRSQQVETQDNYLQRLDEFALKLERLSQSVDQKLVPQPVHAPQTIDDLGLQVDNDQLVFQQDIDQEIPSENQGCSTQNSTGINVDAKLDITTKNERIVESQAKIRLDKTGLSEELSSGMLDQFSDSLLAPFTPLISKVKSFYQHYQQRGLAAVFLMTVAGIITLTLGFTYLLQYSFNHWLSEIGKVSFAFISANTLLALGVYIYKRRAQMQDFASALVGLGLIINYVSAYFSGPYFHLIPDWMSLLLLFIISLFGFFLSFKFETKVVAVLSLVGGSLAPLMLFNEASSQLIYLPYLLLIGCCALVQSRLLRWPLLIELTAFLHIACVELFIVFQPVYFEQLSVMAIIALASINLMFYLYGFSGLYWINESRVKQFVLDKRLLVLPIAMFAFTLISISQLSPDSGYLFLLNAVMFALLYLRVKPPSALKVLALFLAGSFAGFAALQLLDQALLGVVLFAEGLALLYLGYKAFYQSIRAEAYALIVIGLCSHFYTLSLMLDLSPMGLSEVNQYGLSLLYFVLSAVTLYGAVSILKRLIFSANGTVFESHLFTVFRECLSINYVCLILFIAAIINFDYALSVIPLISFLLLYLAKKERLIFSELLAWIILLPLVGAIALGIIDTGTARFSLQPLYAQLARVELFICFIGLYYWYKRFYRQSKFFKLARTLQVLCFFILPLLFLPNTYRNIPEYLSLVMWLSVLISLIFAFIGRHRVLFLQAKLLTILAIVLTAASCLLALWQGLLALAIGAVLFAYLHHVQIKLSMLPKLLLRFQWLLSPYYFALVAVVVVHTSMSTIGFPHWGVVMATLVVYFSLLLRIKPVPLVLREHLYIGVLLMLLSSIGSLFLHLSHGLNLHIDSLLFMFSQMVVLISLWQVFADNGVALRLLTKKCTRLRMQWAWQILLAVSYLLWSYQFSTMIAAPLSAILLVIHGSGLMFVSLKAGQASTIKLAGIFFAVACCKVLFVDMAHFLIIQKVIAFMMIGGILLGVSYFYQKMKNQQKQ